MSSNDKLYMTEDADTLEQHRRAIANELGKAKPRDAVLLPLLKSTYGEHRIFVLNEATSVKSILDKYPALSYPAVVSVPEIFLSVSEHVYCFSYRLTKKWDSLLPNCMSKHISCHTGQSMFQPFFPMQKRVQKGCTYSSDEHR